MGQPGSACSAWKIAPTGSTSSVMWYSTGSLQLLNFQPNRPLQNSRARRVSVAGSSKWTSLPGIAAPSLGEPNPRSAARAEAARNGLVRPEVRVDERDDPAVAAGRAAAAEERGEEVR